MQKKEAVSKKPPLRISGYGRGRPEEGIQGLEKMRKPQRAGTHGNFRIKRNAESALLSRLVNSCYGYFAESGAGTV